MPHGAGVFLTIAGHAGRADRADPARGARHGAEHGLVVDLGLQLAVDHGAAALGDLPLERVAGQALVVVALPHEAPEVGVAGGAFTGLDGRGHRLELVPGGGRAVEAVLVEQVRAVVEHPRAETEGDRHHLVAHHGVLDVAGEVGGEFLVAEVRAQVDEVVGQDAGVDHVDPQDVDVAAAALEHDQVVGEQFAGARGSGDDLDRDVRAGLHERGGRGAFGLAQVGDGVADVGDGGRLVGDAVDLGALGEGHGAHHEGERERDADHRAHGRTSQVRRVGGAGTRGVGRRAVDVFGLTSSRVRRAPPRSGSSTPTGRCVAGPAPDRRRAPRVRAGGRDRSGPRTRSQGPRGRTRSPG